MTQNAAEVFTIQLSRAGAAQADKFLRVRGLQKSDRDDIVAAALLWCWENRDKYDPLIAQLDMWFIRAVRNAWESWRAQDLPTSEESLDKFGRVDETYAAVASESAARALIDALPPASKELAVLTMKGFSRRELIKQGYPERAIGDTYKRIKQMRRLIPDSFESWLLTNSRVVVGTQRKSVSRVLNFGNQRTHVPLSDGSDVDREDDVADFSVESQHEADQHVAVIDLLLTKLDFAPQHGSECPPCWRCKWFEGMLPSGKRDTRMAIEDDEVRAAVKDVEIRKIEIAQQVRDA